MAHLEKLFVSEGMSDRPYQTLNSHVTYKGETATAEVRESRQTTTHMKKEFRPITTEIHVTELRPIKLDPLSKRTFSENQYKNGGGEVQMWERRLQSESGVADAKPQVIDHSYSTSSEVRQEMSRVNGVESSKVSRQTETMVGGQGGSNMVRTVTSRTGSYGGGSHSSTSPQSSPAGTLSPPPYRREKLTAEFKRRDVSPDFKMSDKSVVMVDGKCTCCPYGFHVDVDFMEYVDVMSNQSYLKQLKHIQREKKMLRKSMEVYLQDQEETSGQSQLPNPMENQYRETTTNRLLDDIDSSVDQTLTSIETMMRSSQSQQYTDIGSATMVEPPKKFNTFPKKVGRQVAKELQSYNETFTATFNDSQRADSNSSLSSISTVASERAQGYTTTETTTTTTSSMTSKQLAETMATHLPMEDGAASPQSNMATISKQSLNAIREAMSVSLQRMKDLEEQVKAIPVLQVRISVLKEEKRLLSLQHQAQRHVNTVSRGVGEDTILSPPPVSPQFNFPIKSPPPTLPKPKKTRTAAVGDHSVLESYLLQEDLPSSYTVHDNSMHVFEKETIIIDRARNQHMVYAEEPSRPLTRSVGVGEGNVFDDRLHIHEKELRTVIIGQGSSTGKRNVGIECRVQTRDVGVSYNFDTVVEKPMMRSVGITTETTAAVTNVSFRSEEFTSALRSALAKNVRTMGVQVSSRPELRDVGIQYATSAWNVRTIGVGDCSIDVEVRNPVARRSVSVDAFPDRMNRASNTDYGWRLDSSTNTVNQYMENSFTQTADVRMFNMFTMTDKSVCYNADAQTDRKVFEALNLYKTAGSNTERVLHLNAGMNTTLRPTREMAVNTSNAKVTRNFGMTTDAQSQRTVGVSDDRIDSFVCDLKEEDSDEEFRMSEEGIETKTIYYETSGDQSDTRVSKGFEIKRDYSGDLYSQQGSTVGSSSSSSSVVGSSAAGSSAVGSSSSGSSAVGSSAISSSSMMSSAVVTKVEKEEEEEDLNNEEVVEEKIWRTSGDGQFTVTIVTTRRTMGPDGVDVKTETRTITGGPEVLGSDRNLILEEVRKGRRSSLVISGSRSPSLRSSYSSDSDTDLQLSEGRTAIERILGADVARQFAEVSEQGGMTSSMSSSSSSSTQFSGQTGQLTAGSPDLISIDSGLSSSGGSSEVVTRVTTSSQMLLDRSSPNSNLKSIMKKSRSDPGDSQKRGITFAETVVGGETDDEESDNLEDDDDDDDDDEVEDEEVEENASRGTTSDSDSSFDEGCYDSREGSIVYKCKDDEAIANGIPGAIMFDQNIRETFELTQEMKGACQTLATYLEDSTTIQTKQLNASLSVIQQEWFKVSSSKLAEPYQVEDFLSCFNEISKRLLEYIVNMQDSNGNTAIHYAVSNCNFEVVNLLLDTGICDLNKLNKAGYSAVIMATLASVQTERQQEVVQRLFSMGDVNIKAEKDGQTALMFAVRQGRTEMVKMLLDTGADVNIQDDEGSTALMCAAEHGHTEIIKLLLNSPGCDANISDNDGSTALSISMEAGHKDAGVLLYAHVNFGPGQSPAQTRKTRKSSSSNSPVPSPGLR